MSDGCKIITVVATISANGIIRLEDGLLIGRMTADHTMESIMERLVEQDLRILDEKGTEI